MEPKAVFVLEGGKNCDLENVRKVNAIAMIISKSRVMEVPTPWPLVTSSTKSRLWMWVNAIRKK